MTNKTAFILMPFAAEFLDVYKYLIQDCLQEAGYTVIRADDIKSQNNIISDIIEKIINSDLIVADLTGSNPNVYYELGVAHALNKNVILITQEISELPFDLRSYRVVGYSTHFSKMNQAKDELKKLAEGALTGSIPFGNPVKDFGKTSLALAQNFITIHEDQPSKYEELGIIDYSIMLEDSFETLGAIVSEVGEKLLKEVTPEINKSSERLSSSELNSKQRRDIIRELAEHIKKYGEFVKPKNEKYNHLLKDIETSLENMLNVRFKTASKEPEHELHSFLETLSELESSASEGRNGITKLIGTMESLPKIERDFNRANIFMANELKIFVDNIDQTISIIARAKRIGSALLSKEQLGTDHD